MLYPLQCRGLVYTYGRLVPKGSQTRHEVIQALPGHLIIGGYHRQVIINTPVVQFIAFHTTHKVTQN